MTTDATSFDAIVVGSGISGGWAAKELCEKGLKTLVLERGRNVVHIKDYPTANLAPWELPHRGARSRQLLKENPLISKAAGYGEGTAHFFVKDADHPYVQEKPFDWIRQAPSKVLTLDDQSLIGEIADTLLPTTPSSPGAKAAGAGAAINLLLTDCYEPEAQVRVVNGLKEFRRMCRERCGDNFASLPQREREQVLGEIDAQAQKVGPTYYFGLVRELALRAYFSSEIGMTKALRYVRVPGKWVGCVPLAPGQPAWG